MILHREGGSMDMVYVGKQARDLEACFPQGTAFELYLLGGGVGPGIRGSATLLWPNMVRTHTHVPHAHTYVYTVLSMI